MHLTYDMHITWEANCARGPTFADESVEVPVTSMETFGPSPVRDIHARLTAAKGTNYSTTVKMLSVMLEKGLVKRDEATSPHIYRPTQSREKTGRQMVCDLVEKVYDGAAMSLVLQALASGTASREEIAEARRLLDEMEDRR